MSNKNKEWYNDENVIDLLSFLIPPLGIYGLFKNETINSRIKKILIGTLGILGFLTVMTQI